MRITVVVESYIKATTQNSYLEGTVQARSQSSNISLREYIEIKIDNKNPTCCSNGCFAKYWLSKSGFEQPVFEPGQDIGEAVAPEADPHVLVIAAQHVGRLDQDAFFLRQLF